MGSAAPIQNNNETARGSAMKIDPASSLRTAKSRPNGRARGSQGGDFASALPEGERSGAVQGTAALASIDALMALQGVGSQDERKREAVAHGEGLLDELDALRLDILSGRVPLSRLEMLRGRLAEQAWRAGASDDAKLRGLLAEIETRVAVELAKLGR